MSYSEINRNRDPRYRDRSRSELRRPDSPDQTPPALPAKQEQPVPNSNVVDFFKTLGLNSQLIQALINANPPKVQQVSPPTTSLPQPTVNNAQDFASFLSQSYGLHSAAVSSVNRDPRRRQPPPPNSTPIPPRPEPSTEPQPISYSSHSSMSIDESYKQYLSMINQSLLDGETRKRLQRIALLDNELDKLHRMNIELTKNTARRSRRRSTTRDKDPLLKENEHLQTELLEYVKTLKTTMMMTYPMHLFSNQTTLTQF